MFYATFDFVSLHSQASSIVKFNGLNFPEWSEQVQFHLGVLDLDLTLLIDKLAAITETSSVEQRSFHKTWKRSNRLSLMLILMTITESIRSTIPKIDDAKKFLESTKSISQSDTTDKSIAGTLMSTLTTMKFDGGRTMHEHLTEMKNIATRLKSMGLEVNENFLVQFIMNSLPPQYAPFQINYNTIEDKWNVTELQIYLFKRKQDSRSKEITWSILWVSQELRRN